MLQPTLQAHLELLGLKFIIQFAVLCVTFWGNNNALGSDRFEATDLEDAVIGSGEVTTYIVTKPR